LNNGVPIVDLFCGAGGFSVGAALAGGDVRAMVDIDAVACQTLKRNSLLHSGHVLETDVHGLDGVSLRRIAGVSRYDPLVIVGGAPCQPFSKAAYWTDPGDEARYRRERARGLKSKRSRGVLRARPDSRRSLVGEFWRLVSESQASAFVFENVPSILHPRNRVDLDALLRTAESERFKTTTVIASAVEFGVPQKRTRVFVIGIRRHTPQPPLPTHSAGKDAELYRKPAITAAEAVMSFADRKYFEPEEVVTGRWARHLRTVPPGWNYKAHTAWGGHRRPTFETETRFWNFLLKLHPERPSWTIAANPGPWTGPFHWDSRRLRIPELAALQGFPPGYQFEGTRRERVRQIGNAVPPPLAQKMVEAVLPVLTGSPYRQ
jgi:DNA (cytosine-5)-methyltransferase 1